MSPTKAHSRKLPFHRRQEVVKELLLSRPHDTFDVASYMRCEFPGFLQEFQVKSSTPPTIEMDGSVGALYVRFRKGKVARTIPSNCDSAVINLDLNEDNEVIGIEAVGLRVPA